MADYYELAKQLRSIGLREQAGDMIGRWRLGTQLVDIMPTDEKILGFTNRWYARAIDEAVTCKLPSGREIQLISPPLLIATKLEAFYGRGNGDYASSHDIEDIINVVDGRPELCDEVADCDGELGEYLKDEIDSLLGDERFTSAIAYHISPAVESEGRADVVLERLRRIAGT